MKIEIGDRNKIKNSTIANKVEKKEEKSKFNFWTMVFIPIMVTVVGGIIVWLITK